MIKARCHLRPNETHMGRMRALLKRKTLMKALFLSTILPHGKRMGSEVASQALIDGLRANGRRGQAEEGDGEEAATRAAHGEVL